MPETTSRTVEIGTLPVFLSGIIGALPAALLPFAGVASPNGTQSVSSTFVVQTRAKRPLVFLPSTKEHTPRGPLFSLLVDCV